MLKNYDFALRGVSSDEEKGDILCFHAYNFREEEYSIAETSCKSLLTHAKKSPISVLMYHECCRKVGSCCDYHLDRCVSIFDYLALIGLLAEEDYHHSIELTSARFESLKGAYLSSQTH